MAKLKAKVKALEEVEETLRSAYVKNGDGFALDVEGVDGYALEDVTGLKSALSKERENAAAAARRLQDFADLDPAKAREALKKLGEMSTWSSDDKVKEQIQSVTSQLTEKHKTELSALTGQRDAYLVELKRVLVDAAATAAIAKAKGKVQLLLPHVTSKLQLRKHDDGTFYAAVVDDKGHQKITSKSGSQDPMTIDEFVESLKGDETFQVAFDGSGASGGGARGGEGGGGGKRTVSRQDVDGMSASLEDIAAGKVEVV